MSSKEEYVNALNIIKSFHLELAEKIDALLDIDNVIVESKKMLTFNEAALYIGVSKSYLYKLTSGRKIPHYKPAGKMCYFNLDELQQWLMQNRVNTHDEIAGKAQVYCMANKKGCKK